MNNSNWQERFDKEFVHDLGDGTKGVAFVGTRNGEEYVDFWRGHKIKAFIEHLLEEERQGLVKKIESRLDDVTGQIILTQDGMPYKLALEGHQSALLEVLSLLTKKE